MKCGLARSFNAADEVDEEPFSKTESRRTDTRWRLNILEVQPTRTGSIQRSEDNGQTGEQEHPYYRRQR